MRFYNIFFSPTGGTEKVADIVAKGTKLDAEEIDLIKEPDKLMKVKFEKKDLCLVAVPSYGGRIPSVVTDMFRKVKANGTKAILVAVFGNRMIDDTLLELQDVLEASGFVCIAGMEAVAEHSPNQIALIVEFDLYVCSISHIYHIQISCYNRLNFFLGFPDYNPRFFRKISFLIKNRRIKNCFDRARQRHC